MNHNHFFALILTTTGAIISCGSSDKGNHFSEDAGDASNASGGSSGNNAGGSGGSTGGSNTGGTGGSNTGGTGGNNTGGTGGSNTGGTSGDSGVSTGGASGDASVSTGGTPAEGGVPDASGDGAPMIDAGDGAALMGCAALDACCANLTGPLQTSCDSQVSAGDPTSCTVLIPVFCNGADGGGTATDAGSACNDLSACCTQLQTGQQAQCEQLAGLGLAGACAAALSAYQSSGSCN